jgi:hypothetical protein
MSSRRRSLMAPVYLRRPDGSWRARLSRMATAALVMEPTWQHNRPADYRSPSLRRPARTDDGRRRRQSMLMMFPMSGAGPPPGWPLLSARSDAALKRGPRLPGEKLIRIQTGLRPLGTPLNHSDAATSTANY